MTCFDPTTEHTIQHCWIWLGCIPTMLVLEQKHHFDVLQDRKVGSWLVLGLWVTFWVSNQYKFGNQKGIYLLFTDITILVEVACYHHNHNDPAFSQLFGIFICKVFLFRAMSDIILKFLHIFHYNIYLYCYRSSPPFLTIFITN